MRLVAGDHGDPAAADELARRFAEDASAPGAGSTRPRWRRRGTPRWCCSIAGWCACTRTACRERSPSAWWRCSPSAAPRTTRSSRSTTRRAAKRSTSARPASTGATRAAGSRCWRRPIAATRISPSPGTASITTTAREVVRFEGLRPGDVVEIQYLVDDVSSENQMADYFGDLQYVAETIPKRRWDYTLIAPESRPDPRQCPAAARGWNRRPPSTATIGSIASRPPTSPRSTPSRPCRGRRRRRLTCTSAPTRPGPRSAPGTGTWSKIS